NQPQRLCRFSQPFTVIHSVPQEFHQIPFFCELSTEPIRVHICFIHVSFHLSYNDLFINSTKLFLTIKKEWTKHTRSYPFLSLWQICLNIKNAINTHAGSLRHLSTIINNL